MSTPLLHNESALLEALRAGQSTAFRDLMHTYYPVLLRFTSGMVEDHALAEDIAEEAFIQLWKHHPSFDSLHSVRKFLWVTARRDCLDVLRQRDRHKRHQKEIASNSSCLDEISVLNELIRAEVLSDIYAAIRQLPEKMQRVFTLSYIEGLKNQEIADNLHISEQTVRNQKSRALEILRLQFSKVDPAVIAWISCIICLLYDFMK